MDIIAENTDRDKWIVYKLYEEEFEVIEQDISKERALELIAEYQDGNSKR